MKKNAFTMAEMLITIGVIGAVCAISLPALNTAIFDAQRSAMVKSTYAKLTEAWDLAVLEMEYAPKCAYWGPGLGANPSPYQVDTVIDPVTGQKRWYIKGTNTPLPDNHNGLFTDCKDFGENILKQLVVTQECPKNAYAKGCTPNYDGNDAISAWNGAEGKEVTTAISGMGGFTSNNINKNNHAYVLKDGTIIVGYFSTNYFHPRIFAVDVNGKKGPNQWGYDLFAFKSQFGSDGKKINLIGVNMPMKDGGVNVTEILANKK